MGTKKKSRQTNSGNISVRRAPHTEVSVDINDIRFTHSKVFPNFSGCGVTLEETLRRLLCGEMDITKLPKITVVQSSTHPNVYYTLNNRRLWVLKELRCADIISSVVVRLRQMTPREQTKYTIDRCTLEATIIRTPRKKYN